MRPCEPSNREAAAAVSVFARDTEPMPRSLQVAAALTARMVSSRMPLLVLGLLLGLQVAVAQNGLAAGKLRPAY